MGPDKAPLVNSGGPDGTAERYVGSALRSIKGLGRLAYPPPKDATSAAASAIGTGASSKRRSPR